MIQNDDECAAVLAQVNTGIQEISNYLGSDRNDAKIRFPYGYLRTCPEHREGYTFIRSDLLKRNISYTLLLVDVLRWIVNRTTLGGPAQNMVFKHGIVLYTSIVEAIMKHYLDGYGANQTFNVQVGRLIQHAGIGEQLAEDLRWLWSTRQGIHLGLLDRRDHEQYSLADTNRARETLRALRLKLTERGPLPIRR